MHGELGPNPHEDSLTSYTCYMMPCLFSDRNAHIDSNPDTSAFMRDRSQVPYAKVLTKCACTKSDQIRSRGVGRNIREASRSKWTRVDKFARGKTKIDLLQDTTIYRMSL